MAGRYELVIFDWDGTLMDSIGKIVACWQEAFMAMELAPPSAEILRSLIGLSTPASIERLAPQLSQPAQRRFCDLYRHHYRVAEQVPSELYPGVPELLSQLSDRGYTLAVATGKGRPGLDRVLAQTGLGPLFPHTRSASETHSKPDPAMVLELCQLNRVSPDRTLVVGDAWFDLEMARRAGADGVGVSYGAGTRSSLCSAGPKAIIDSPLQLLNHLD
ncbi:HAD-IA family hydrolase [Ferrimonas gelatinilytica]|uniref:HAD family hydrolase n=1 Tax=Ferrimonas gelatinilytica TaxID=1255257 RepID=A0ABP9S1C3_9GAMM